MGYTIPVGTIVETPVHVIHHDAEIWPEPKKFDPERYEISFEYDSYAKKIERRATKRKCPNTQMVRNTWKFQILV